MDDFFIPKKHNFHPNDIIDDLKQSEEISFILMVIHEIIIMK